MKKRIQENFCVRFKPLFNDNENLPTIILAKNVRGAKRKFTLDWGKEYKIVSIEKLRGGKR